MTAITPDSNRTIQASNNSSFVTYNNQYVFYFTLHYDATAEECIGKEFTVFFNNCNAISNSGGSWITLYHGNGCDIL